MEKGRSDSFNNFKVLINYLIHNCVCPNDVVSVRPQASKGCWGIRLHFLLRRERGRISEKKLKLEQYNTD